MYVKLPIPDSSSVFKLNFLILGYLNSFFSESHLVRDNNIKVHLYLIITLRTLLLLGKISLNSCRFLYIDLPHKKWFIGSNNKLDHLKQNNLTKLPITKGKFITHEILILKKLRSYHHEPRLWKNQSTIISTSKWKEKLSWSSLTESDNFCLATSIWKFRRTQGDIGLKPLRKNLLE